MAARRWRHPYRAGQRTRALQRPRPTWEPPRSPRSRQATTVQPVRRASACASTAAWSEPRRRSRSGVGGTGTSAAPAKSPSGAVAAMAAAIEPATPSAAWNFSALTSARAAPS